MIIDKTYFFGERAIPQLQSGSDVEVQLAWFIDEKEPRLLELLLGYDFYNTLITLPSLGTEELSNPNFTGNASGWTLNNGWQYGSNKVTFASVDGPESLYYLGTLNTTKKYKVSFDVMQLTSGFIFSQFGNNKITAAIGTNTFEGNWANVLGHGGIIVYFMPSADFDGSIDNVSVKEITNERWLDIIDGKVYTDLYGKTRRWVGLKYISGTTKLSLIANYIYFYFYRDIQTQSSAGGEKRTQSESSTDADPSFKLANAWNEMVRLNFELRMFLLSNVTVYPEYTDPLYDRNKYRRELYAKNNPLW